MSLRTPNAGERQWRLTYIFPNPTDWFSEPVAFLGLALFGLGVAAWFGSLAQPDPHRLPMVAARYSEFAVAGHLFLLCAMLSTIGFTSDVVTADTGGLVWKSIAFVRSTPNLIIAGALALFALISYALSVGRARHLHFS